MQVLSATAYAQTRIQSRYGERADENVWLRLQNIHDLGSYLQTAQQTPLRPWVLGLSSTHSSHDIELALRQKFRHHVDEVAGWMPIDWRKPLHWIKRLADLPALQYLAAGGEPLGWMNSDHDLRDFTADDPLLRLQALNAAGCSKLVESWQQNGALLPGWLSQWSSMQPRSPGTEKGMQSLQKLLHLQAQQVAQQGLALAADYEEIIDGLRLVFRRYAFQPAAVCAYLAIVAIDLHRVRSDLMQRLYFKQELDLAEELSI